MNRKFFNSKLLGGWFRSAVTALLPVLAERVLFMAMSFIPESIK